ncbi:MAG: OmpA family protein [Fibromonadaceae bacterium]|jgi:outer membrane protein OmpA-like peptidoglycan-associated protein|nr:OmpA family protein [Fibromonadaceae bacterium]
MNKLLLSLAIFASAAFSADLTIRATDYNQQYAQRYKTIVLKGRKGTYFETKTDGNGIARVQVSEGDIYSFWCDGITGEFDCGFGNTLAVQMGAGSGTWEIYYDDDRFELKGVNFATGKADILPNSTKILEATVKGLQKYDTVNVEISGHTDIVGGLEYNEKLSQARAEAVRNYLIRKGIAENRIRAVGYGYSRPRADNKTENGRAQNRRIEISIVN